jgi:ParB family chromosome partitioning protein
LHLPDEILRIIEEGGLSAGHGRALLQIGDPETRRALAKSIVDNGWSVREAERVAKRAGKIAPKKLPVLRTVDPNVKSAETKLMRNLNTNVKIVPGKKGTGGKIEIEYYSIDDLDRVFQLLIKK